MTTPEQQREPAPLVARCTQCAGDVALALAGPQPTCQYCGAQDPLQPDVRTRLAALRGRIAGRTAREQQLTGRQARLGRTYGLGFLLTIVCMWLLVFLVVYFMIDTPKGMTLGQLLFSVHQPMGGADDAAVKWWIVFLMVTGLAAVLMFFAVGMIFLRRVVRHALPISPLAPGRPPRCRCCAGELPAAGALRRCEHCGADHLVLGERYQRREASLEAALARVEAALEGTLATRQRRADRLVLACTLLPAAIALGSPVGFVLGASRPDLWIVPAALAGLAAVFGLIARSIAVPAIRTFEEMLAGDRVLLMGQTYRVATSLSYMFGGYAPIELLSTEPGYPDEVTRAVQLNIGGEGPSRLFEVQPGGAPLDEPHADDALVPGSPSRQTAAGRFADQSLRVWAYFAGRGGGPCRAALEAETVRLWVGVDPRDSGRPAPDLTLCSPRDVDPERALLLNSEG